MKTQHLLFLMAVMSCLCLTLDAQTPILPTKGELSQNLSTAISFSKSSEKDIINIPISLDGDYTLEVKAKINSAVGRGLDVESRDDGAIGFRTSMDTSSLKWTASLAASKGLTQSDNTNEQTIRYVIDGSNLHLYQNGYFIKTQELVTLKEITDNGSEVEPTFTKGENLTSAWSGNGGNGSPKDYGWDMSGGIPSWGNANSGGGCRFIDVSATSTNKFTLNGEYYEGRVWFIRWDGNPYANGYFYYPVTLEANTTYDFSMLYSYWTNAGNGSKSITVGASRKNDGTEIISSKTFSSSSEQGLMANGNFAFKTTEAGTYYIVISGAWGLYGIADLSLNSIHCESRMIFGKNYLDGDVDMSISEITFEEGAYAPKTTSDNSRQDIKITGEVVTTESFLNSNVSVNGKTDLHIQSSYKPLINSTVYLNSDNAWLYFDNIRPSDVVSDWLGDVKINGEDAVEGENIRVAIYAQGTVIIPHGNETSKEALEVFTETNFNGSSKKLEIQTYHRELAEFDNTIKSFKLKRGYMATLATNHDGSGYSRVFIADKSDLELNELPTSLDEKISFIRIFKWEWVSKKGWAGGGLPVDLTNSTWHYDWNIGGVKTIDHDYVMIRHNAGWPSWEDINNKTDLNHLLGFNEPDRPDQANMTIEKALEQWPEMMKSGTRLGSPSPASPHQSWISDFINQCDELNYRVDYVAIHCYWNSLSPQAWYDNLKGIYNRVKRPLWITEWNNGANWTNETWPSDPDAQFQKQYEDLKGILQVFDTASFIERYSIYNWVEDKRAMVLADTLTPAGKYYSANKSNISYNADVAYVHEWHLASPNIYTEISEDDYSKVNLSFLDLNGEMGKKYVLERKIENTDADFVTVKEYSSFEYGSTLTFLDDVFTKATYRIKAYGLDDSFIYSKECEVIMDNLPVTPNELTGEVLSSSIINLEWTEGNYVRAYNLKRSTNENGPFEVIGEKLVDTWYVDTVLQPSTTYYYVVTTLNSAGESANSDTLPLTTKDLVIPSSIENPRIAAGDKRIILTWDFVYDAEYDVFRSSSETGTFETIANNFNGTRYEDKTGIQNNKTYYYKIIPKNEKGSGPETGVLSGTPEKGHHLHIDFNEATGSIAADAWGGYHGTLIDSAYWTTGHNNGSSAVKFTQLKKSHIQLEEGVISELNDFTFAFWTYLPENIGNYTRLFDFGSSTGTYMMLAPKVNEGIRYKLTCSKGIYDKTIDYALPTDEWVHLAISLEETTFKMFLNGNLIYENEEDTIKPSDVGVTTNNYLGRSQWPNDPYANLAYDDFTIYNYALTEANIQHLSNDEPLEDDSTLPTDSTTNISYENISQDIFLYPNPTSGKVVYLRNEDRSLVSGIDILDIGGNLISHKVPVNKSDVELNVADLLPGIYFVRVSLDNRIRHIRFVKK